MTSRSNPRQKQESHSSVFLSDSPADKDAFGPHAQIAQAIADIICDSTADGGKTIGLTGTWGSGKSTVLEMVRKKLNAVHGLDCVEAKLFVFDSWAHEGDPLRRSFLEELDGFLRSEKWEECGNWKGNLRALKAITQQTTTTRVTGLSRVGIWFAALLPLAVVANSLLNHYGFDFVFPFKMLGVPGWVDFLQWISAFLLIIIALSPLLILVGRKKTDLSDNQHNTSFSLLLQKTPEVETQSFEREANPTSLEFRDCFLEMMETVLDPPNRRLVIAFDNLDRIDSTEALQIISAMRVFMDPFMVRAHDYLKKLWIILPIDTNSLEKLWQQTSHIQDDHERTNPCMNKKGGNNNNKANSERASAFVDKIIHIRFQVPEPVLVAWRDYLMTMLSMGFPDPAVISDSDASLIVRLFYRKGIPREHPVAPRDIKTFVNQLVALYRVRTDIPLPILAAYVLYFNEIESPDMDFGRTDIVPTTVSHLLVPYLSEHTLNVFFAALRYQISIADAQHTTISPRIVEALERGDCQSIKRDMAEVKGYPEVCLHVVEDCCALNISGNTKSIIQAAAALQHIDVKENAISAQIWEHLYVAAKNAPKFSGVELETVDGFLAILRYSRTVKGKEHPIFLAKLLEKLAHSLPEREEDIRCWIEGVIPILQQVPDEHGSLIENHFRIEPSPATFSLLIRELGKVYLSEDLIVMFRPNVAITKKGNQFFSSVLDDFGRGQHLESRTNPIYILKKYSDNWPWETASQYVSNTILSRSDQNWRSFFGVLQILLSLKILALGPSPTTSELDNSILWEGLYLSSKERLPIGVAYYAFLKWLYWPEGHGHPKNLEMSIKKKYNEMTNKPGDSQDVIRELAILVVQLRSEKFFHTLLHNLRLEELESEVSEEARRIIEQEETRRRGDYERALHINPHREDT
ncbi:MAG: hypothetical protein HY912_16285 [Desulfomonile tiedjei]|uniref:KAP NTPase domain-containing protein n=1 Tax=Desulfomonile tiedjei TaxID=2358 RepID=A0A9D6V568_9BACT|nr:hypothetical protein [Desulfomonile tiedjei]